MKSSIKVAAAMALLTGGAAFAGSTMEYQVGLGGDNHAALWEAGQLPAYTRHADPGADKTYNIGDVINWDVLVYVYGTHSGDLGDGLPAGGAANMVFDLELWKDGSLVSTFANAAMSAGQPTTAGWFSSINDGDADGARGELDGADPLKNAAFAMVFNVDSEYTGPNRYRVFDPAEGRGPGLEYFHYPSAGLDPVNGDANGLPAGNKAPGGKLVGMGAGYKEFLPVAASGKMTGGVGMDPADPSGGLCVALGKLPLFEGQISTLGMEAGTYTLKVVAGAGNNILHTENSICELGASRFAVPVNTVLGDEINFTLQSVGAAPTITAAESVKTHGAAGDFGIDVTSTSAVEPRIGGPTKLVVTFQENIAQLNTAADVTVSSGTVSALEVSGAVLTVTLSGVTDKSVLSVGFPGIADANNVAYACADTLCFTTLVGDASSQAGGSDGTTNIFDLISVKNTFDRPANASNFQNDVSSQANDGPDGVINIFDIIAIKNNFDRNITDTCP